MSLFKKLKNFYNESPENKTQVYVFLGFVVIPIVGMMLLYIVVRIFLL